MDILFATFAVLTLQGYFISLVCTCTKQNWLCVCPNDWDSECQELYNDNHALFFLICFNEPMESES